MAMGAKRVTLRDVATKVGVSPATVSYVLSGRRNGADRISEATRERVLQAVSDLNYVPNQAARILRRQRTERVCLVLPRLNSPYYDALAQDLQASSQDYGYSLYIAAAGTESEERAIMKQIKSGFADGVVIEPRFIGREEILPLVDSGVAVVVESDYIREHDGYDIVRSQRAELTLAAVEHLIELGHTRIAFLGNFDLHPSHYGRFDSYRQALRKNDLELDEELIVDGSGSREAAYRTVKKLLSMQNRPTALFSASDIGAISALWAAKEVDLSIPAEFAVIGVGNTIEGRLSQPPLSSIGPTSVRFRQIADLLFDRLDRGGSRQLPGRVLVREWKLYLRGTA